MYTDEQRILIVEDSETQAVLLTAMLEQEGRLIEWKATAEEALEAVSRNYYSLIIVDYHLPGMNGDQFCRNVKMDINYRSIPVLMLTVEDSLESERRALESGADSFLPKETDREILQAKIESILEKTKDDLSLRKHAAQFHRSHILAVDDSPTYLAFLEESFRNEGIQLDTAQGGQQALEKIKNNEYDCILLDLVMPEIDGIAVCKEISKSKYANNKFLVVMMLTAHEGKEEMMNALEAGADDFVGKSNDISILKARLTALLRRRYIQLDNQKIWRELKEKELEADRARIEKEAAEEKAKIANKLKDSEERFRKIFENNSDGGAILDSSGIVIMINSAGLLLLGKNEEDLLGRPFPYDMGSDDTSSIQVKDDDGSEKIVEIKRVQIPFGDEEACLMSMRNVTEREHRLQKTAENLRTTMDRLTASQSQLIEAEKLGALGVLTAGIAHELNNPMMGMLNYTQYCLKHVPQDNKSYKVLLDSERETKRCIEIVKNLLTFSRMEKASDEQFEKIHCSTILDRVLKLLKYRVEKKNVSVIRIGEESLPEIQAKASNIQQVFLNIIGNALDAVSEKDEQVIQINCSLEEDLVRVEISDNGPGIKKEIMSSVFDPFFTTKPPGKGTGLGLSVSRSIIEVHQGKIKCKSEPEKGTTFTIKLPVRQPSATV